MKNTLSLSLLALFLVPAQLSATVIGASIWKRPNGTHIVLIGDVRDASRAEKQQAADCINHLQNQNNIHVSAYRIAQPIAPSNFALTMEKFLINRGSDLEVRYLFAPGDLVADESDVTIHCHNCREKILNESILKEGTIPAPLKTEFKQLQSLITNCIGVLPQSHHIPMFGLCEDCNGIDAIRMSENARIFLEWYVSLHTHLLVSRLTEPSVANKATYMYVEDSNFKPFEDLLAKIGYTRIATHSACNGNPLNLKAIFASVNK